MMTWQEAQQNTGVAGGTAKRSLENGSGRPAIHFYPPFRVLIILKGGGLTVQQAYFDGKENIVNTAGQHLYIRRDDNLSSQRSEGEAFLIEK